MAENFLLTIRTNCVIQVVTENNYHSQTNLLRTTFMFIGCTAVAHCLQHQREGCHI